MNLIEKSNFPAYEVKTVIIYRKRRGTEAGDFKLDVENVVDFNSAFYKAVIFDDDLSSWRVNNVKDNIRMLYAASRSRERRLQNGWADSKA